MSIVPVLCFIHKVREQVRRAKGGMCMCVKSEGAQKCATPHKLLRGRGEE